MKFPQLPLFLPLQFSLLSIKAVFFLESLCFIVSMISSFHLCLGQPCILFPGDIHSNIFFDHLVSSILTVYPYQTESRLGTSLIISLSISKFSLIIVFEILSILVFLQHLLSKSISVV